MVPRVRTDLGRLWLAFAFLCCLAMPGLAGEPAVSGYEVKFYLNPEKVLTGNEPTKSVMDRLGIQAGPTKLRMQFLDGKYQDLHVEHWNVRFRDKGKEKWELTYKRRYPVQGDDIDGAVVAAARQGFDAGKSDYEVEVEWGFKRQTLSFTPKKEVEGPSSAPLPKAGDARQFAVDKLPEKLAHWIHDGWAKSVLSGAHVYGPVDGKRWTGKRDEIDNEITLEVWEIRKSSGDEKERVVEVSFKKKDRSEAKESRERLSELLYGWLLEDDVLKTELILKRYAPPQNQ